MRMVEAGTVLVRTNICVALACVGVGRGGEGRGEGGEGGRRESEVLLLAGNKT